jgi:hypothetical protein
MSLPRVEVHRDFERQIDAWGGPRPPKPVSDLRQALRYVLHKLAAIEETEETGGHRSAASWRRPFISDSINLSAGLEITASGSPTCPKRPTGRASSACTLPFSQSRFCHLFSVATKRSSRVLAVCAPPRLEPSATVTRRDANYATLIELADVSSIFAFDCSKRDRRGWVMLRSRQLFLDL